MLSRMRSLQRPYGPVPQRWPAAAGGEGVEETSRIAGDRAGRAQPFPRTFATASATAITGTFEYTVGIGAGRIEMSRTTPVETESWGSLKARYREPQE